MKKRTYSRGDYRSAVSTYRPCMYCGKPTTRRSGRLGHHICSKCGKKWNA